PELRFAAVKRLRKALLGLAAAIAIGTAEELLFRGGLLHRMARDLGRMAAVILTALVYAAVHAVRTGASRGGAVTIWSGLERSAAPVTPLLERDAMPGNGGLVGRGGPAADALTRT